MYTATRKFVKLYPTKHDCVTSPSGQETYFSVSVPAESIFDKVSCSPEVLGRLAERATCDIPSGILTQRISKIRVVQSSGAGSATAGVSVLLNGKDLLFGVNDVDVCETDRFWQHPITMVPLVDEWEWLPKVASAHARRTLYCNMLTFLGGGNNANTTRAAKDELRQLRASHAERKEQGERNDVNGFGLYEYRTTSSSYSFSTDDCSAAVQMSEDGTYLCVPVPGTDDSISSSCLVETVLAFTSIALRLAEEEEEEGLEEEAAAAEEEEDEEEGRGRLGGGPVDFKDQCAYNLKCENDYFFRRPEFVYPNQYFPRGDLSYPFAVTNGFGKAFFLFSVESVSRLLDTFCYLWRCAETLVLQTTGSVEFRIYGGKITLTPPLAAHICLETFDITNGDAYLREGEESDDLTRLPVAPQTALWANCSPEVTCLTTVYKSAAAKLNYANLVAEAVRDARDKPKRPEDHAMGNGLWSPPMLGNPQRRQQQQQQRWQQQQQRRRRRQQQQCIGEASNTNIRSSTSKVSQWLADEYAANVGQVKP